MAAKVVQTLFTCNQLQVQVICNFIKYGHHYKSEQRWTYHKVSVAISSVAIIAKQISCVRKFVVIINFINPHPKHLLGVQHDRSGRFRQVWCRVFKNDAIVAFGKWAQVRIYVQCGFRSQVSACGPNLLDGESDYQTENQHFGLWYRVL